jgi:hypothetical protein
VCIVIYKKFLIVIKSLIMIYKTLVGLGAFIEEEDSNKLHCKKELAIFPSPAGMSLSKLSLGGKKLNYSRPGRV